MELHFVRFRYLLLENKDPPEYIHAPLNPSTPQSQAMNAIPSRTIWLQKNFRYLEEGVLWITMDDNSRNVSEVP